MNNVILIGRLTKDLEVKELEGGKKVANFTLAVSRKYKNEEGKVEADFINCVAWNETSERIKEFCKKGDLLGVTGRLTSSSYEKDEVKHYKTEVIVENISFLTPKKVEVVE